MEININSRSQSEEAPKQSECESCKNLCTEAKEQVKVQDKKIYKMTIALAVALTLIGQEAADKAVSLFDSITSITDKAEGVASGDSGSDSKEESDNDKAEQEPKEAPSINISIPTNAFNNKSSRSTPPTPTDSLIPLPSPSTTPLSRLPYSGFTPTYSPSTNSAPVPSALFPLTYPLVRSSVVPPIAEPWKMPSSTATTDRNVCFDVVPPPATLTTLVAGLWIINRRA